MKSATLAAVHELTFNQAINEALRLEMRRDPTIVIMGEDIAGGAGLAHLGFVDSCHRSQVSRERSNASASRILPFANLLVVIFSKNSQV
jgi:hypothetical protein